MNVINGSGSEPLHVWLITTYDTSKWVGNPIMAEHYNMHEDIIYLSNNYLIPLKGIVVSGTPYDRLSMFVMILKQRSVKYGDKFYLTECEIPYDFCTEDGNPPVGQNAKVLLPYICMNWVRSINFIKKYENGSSELNYSCNVLYENEYNSLLHNIFEIKQDKDVLQKAINEVYKLREQELVYNYYVSNLDLLKSIMVRSKEIDNNSLEYQNICECLKSDVKKGEFCAFEARKKIYLDSYVLKSYKYLWELYKGVESKEDYRIDFDNTPDYIKNVNRVLEDRERQKEREKEKERIRKEKEEIARKKSSKKYGKVDDRVNLEQNSFRWWGRWFANKITFGIVRPPKTLRSDDYREEFMKRNPGLFIDGFYICIYCGKPITSDSQDRKKKMFVDHIKPINQGGRNSTWNLGPACQKCNLEKSDKGGEWVIRGYVGKVGYTALQVVSNVSKTLLFGYKNKNPLKKAVSIGFYVYTGLWIFRLFI